MLRSVPRTFSAKSFMVTLLAPARIRREVQFQSGTVCFVKVSSRGVFREENVNHRPRTVACFNQTELRINQNFAPVRFQRGPSTKLATSWITPNVPFQSRRTVCFTHLSSYERFFVRKKNQKKSSITSGRFYGTLQSGRTDPFTQVCLHEVLHEDEVDHRLRKTRLVEEGGQTAAQALPQPSPAR